MNKKAIIFLVIFAAIMIAGIFFQDMIHKKYKELTGGVINAEPSSNDEGHDESALTMSSEERDSLGITTAVAELREIAEEITVPGEVKIDLYRSAQITPRISAQIVERHARMGDTVKKGNSLVTLSSVDMAEAQGDLIVANREWQRVRDLGKEVVSERRFIEAQVAAQQARAKVIAFGMTPDQVEMLLQTEGAGNATGTFKLYAPQDGTIVNDNFVVGEIVEPGTVLFGISDETFVWVEAQLRTEQTTHIEVGTPVHILAEDKHPLQGEVIQIHHNLDEMTRTLPVRIEVRNVNDELHTGQFVSVVIRVGQPLPVLAVPESAVTLIDGSQTVFKLDGDEIRPEAIETGVNKGGWIEVKSGLNPGDEIVVTETFLLKSLILKSQMGEGHGH